MTKQLENMASILEANKNSPMALMGHIGDFVAGIRDAANRIESLEADVAALKKAQATK